MPTDWPALLAHPNVQTLFDLALAEDVGLGDVTTQAIFRAPRRVQARIAARSATVMCGGPLATALLARFDPEVKARPLLEEGADVTPGAVLVELEADVRALLTVERTLLNFMMRLCGVAAAARAAVQRVPPETRARIYDTRKTMPGWRLLDKAAVRAGGAENHRVGLFDMVLIKDNHVAAAGSVGAALAAARARVGTRLRVEVEIDDLAQLDEALAGGPDVILLDNFGDDDMREAVRRVAGRCELEASGGITLDRIASVARSGVDRISLGAITHSARPADLGMDF